MKIQIRYFLIIFMVLIAYGFTNEKIKNDWTNDKPNDVSSGQSFIDDEDRDREKKKTYELVEKIKSQKTNRLYSDGFSSTPIYKDNNGYDYIIVRTPNSAKIVYLDDESEVVLNQGVAILLDL